MKLIKPSFEIWEQEPSLEGVFKQIERAGRVCYKSEDKIAEGTAKAFVDRMIASGHGAMLEHGTVYLLVEADTADKDVRLWELANNEYSEINYIPSTDLNYITTNYRVLVENDWLDLLKYQCEPTEYHAKRITVKFICDRGVSHEFVRHRVFSFAQESTRYCNYSKDKFGNDCTFIIPCWLDEKDIIEEFGSLNLEYDKDIDKFQSSEWSDAGNYLQSLAWSEASYLTLLQNEWTPQQARSVLPNSLKTELVMTGTIEQWKGFFKLRDAGSAHPQAYELAHPLHEEFIKRGYVAV